MPHDREGLAASIGEGDAAPVTGVNDSGQHVPNPKPPRPSPPRYNHAQVDVRVLQAIRVLEPTNYRELARELGYGMYVLTNSVARLREAGLIIPGVPGRRGFLVAVRSPEVNPPEPRCCCENDGLPYCGDPECDIYFCQDCGDEFNEPCPRHVTTPYEAG